MGNRLSSQNGYRVSFLVASLSLPPSLLPSIFLFPRARSLRCTRHVPPASIINSKSRAVVGLLPPSSVLHPLPFVFPLFIPAAPRRDPVTRLSMRRNAPLRTAPPQRARNPRARIALSTLVLSVAITASLFLLRLRLRYRLTRIGDKAHVGDSCRRSAARARNHSRDDDQAQPIRSSVLFEETRFRARSVLGIARAPRATFRRR